MWVVRRQFPVGQGCFHAGAVGLGDRMTRDQEVVRYVYDCGSTSQGALKAALEQYVSGVPSIDALFVSHLHDDHVSGLDRLLTSVRADTVYIPYIDDIVPILDLLEAEREGAITRTLIEAVTEPEIWFGQRGVRRVVRVSGQGDPPSDGPFVPEIPPEGLRSVVERVRLIERPEPRLVRRGKWGERSDLLEMLPGSSIAISVADRMLDWLFLPYTHPAPRERRDEFWRAIRDTLDLRARQRLTAARLCDALKHQPARESLRDCYNEIMPAGARRKHNRISMSLYSGPTGRKENAAWEHEILAKSFTGRLWWGTSEAVGWIGTGDTTLNAKSVREAWRKNYQPVESQVATLLLPHHGSQRSFHQELIEPHSLKLCIASAGSRSTYRHPSPSVVDEVGARGKCFWQVSQRPNSGLVEVIRAR